MNNPEQDLENILRQAPKPLTPQNLKEKLMHDASIEFRKTSLSTHSYGTESWGKRWWSILVPAAASLACVVVIAAQRIEINQLKQSSQILSAAAAPGDSGNANRIAADPSSRPVSAAATESQANEITRLKQAIASLTADIEGLTRIKAENEKLRAQLAAASRNGFTAEELEAVQQARERAESTRCINNLKQIGLSVRVWANDNNNIFPTNFLCMSNILNTPLVLVCPADTNRPVVRNFDSYTDANCSYELFAGSDREPNQVLTKCPIHGNIGLCDGSVQMGVAKRHPENLYEQDGKLYMKMQ